MQEFIGGSMEKTLKFKHHQITCPKVIIFKEDLEQLAELFSDNFNEIEIEADGFKLANISEINELKKDIITDFKIGGRDKDTHTNEMSIDISRKSGYIYITSYNDTKCIGVKNKIDEILIRRRKLINIIDSKWIFILPALINFILFYILGSSKNYDLGNYIAYSLLIILISFLLIITLIAIPFFITNAIHLKYSHEKPSFYKRNKDNIIVGAICAMFGTVIGGLII